MKIEKNCILLLFILPIYSILKIFNNQPNVRVRKIKRVNAHKNKQSIKTLKKKKFEFEIKSKRLKHYGLIKMLYIGFK